MTTTVDSKRRVVLPGAQPGDVFDVQRDGADRLLLVRLARPAPPARLTRAQCLRAMAAAPLQSRLAWDRLRVLTREP